MRFRLINRSRLTSQQVAAMAVACELQLKRDVCPAWNLNPDLVSVTIGALKPGEVPVTLWDTEDPGDFGYHSFGPGAQVFVGGILESGAGILTGQYSVAHVLSHELIETLVDPRASNWDASGYAFEACDPVQGLHYDLGGVSVSDFVVARWFDRHATHGAPMDLLGSVTADHALGPGGYAVAQNSQGVATELFSARDPAPGWRLLLRARVGRRLWL